MQFDPTFRDDVLSDELWQRAMVELALPPPGRYGTLRVTHHPARDVPLYGQQLTLSAPVAWTLLVEGARLWMSDTPQERLMMAAGTAGMRGHVLVAGGGLGMYPQYLLRYCPVERVTVVERHPDIVAALQTTLGRDPAVELVCAPFESFIAQDGDIFDSAYIDIHPTINPRWLPGLNRLRDACAGLVNGPLRIWGYHWMLREFVRGLEQSYISPLRRGLCVDDPLGRDLLRALPESWQDWPEEPLRAWLSDYACCVAWPVEWDDKVD